MGMGVLGGLAPTIWPHVPLLALPPLAALPAGLAWCLAPWHWPRDPPPPAADGFLFLPVLLEQAPAPPSPSSPLTHRQTHTVSLAYPGLVLA